VNDNNNQSGFYLLSDNTDAFVARFALATMSLKTLDIQYYIMHNDASGQYLAYAILSAADRGVQIRILLDDINLQGRDSSLKMLSQHENIKIHIFNPLINRGWLKNIELLFNLNRAGRRMHNKIFIADNSVAIIGGRNIGDEYFDNRENLNLVDLDLLTIGPIVNDISTSFNEFWNCHLSIPIESLSKAAVIKRQLTGMRHRLKDRWKRAKNSHHFQTLRQSDLTKKIIEKNIPFVWANANIFYDKPDKVRQDISNKSSHFGPNVSAYAQSAYNEILLVSPYFVPSNTAMQWLADKRKANVKIKVLTNSLSTTDVVAVHAGYRNYRKRLLQHGINLFELKSTAQTLRAKTKSFIKGLSVSSLHAKYMVIDQQYVFIGSANFDPRSNALNTEIGIVVDSKELAKQTKNLFDRTTSEENSYRLQLKSADGNKKPELLWETIEQGKNIRFSAEPKASFRKKLIVFIASLLPIENLL